MPSPRPSRAMSLNLASLEPHISRQQIHPARAPEQLLFLMQNLVYRDEHFEWRINLPALASNMGQLISFPGAATTRVYNGKAMFISGGLSNYVQPENHELIYRMFPKAEFAVITGAGHWVHADQPERLVSRVKEFL